MWPINPSLITLRVCADLGWQVTVRCSRCSVGTTIHPKSFPVGKLASAPLHDLFRQGAFKCRKPGCDGAPASSLDVSCMDVGMLKTVAEWGT